MTPAQQVIKKRATKLRMLRLKTAQAKVTADKAEAASRTAKVGFKRARKAHKDAKKAAKAARKQFEELQRKLNKISPAKPEAALKRHRNPGAAPAPAAQTPPV